MGLLSTLFKGALDNLPKLANSQVGRFAIDTAAQLYNDRAKHNPNFDAAVGPTLGKYGADSDGIDLGNNSEKIPLHYNKTTPEFQSGIILNDDGLKILKAIHSEKDQLSKLGLKIDPTDDVRVVRNSSGEIVAAIAFGEKNVNQIKKIKYIDIDKDSQNVCKCLSQLAQTEQSTNPLRFYESEEVDLERYDIIY